MTGAGERERVGWARWLDWDTPVGPWTVVLVAWEWGWLNLSWSYAIGRSKGASLGGLKCARVDEEDKPMISTTITLGWLAIMQNCALILASPSL